MSTITIRDLLGKRELRSDRGFNSLFAAYATARRKECGKCRRKKADMTVCLTLLNSLAARKRDILARLFDIPPGVGLKAYKSGEDLGLKVT